MIAPLTPDRAERFVRERTTLSRPALVPEITLHLATEITPLWEETAALLGSVDASPLWAFVWPGGHALARYVLDHPALAAGRRVFDFGSGSGLVAIAAALAGAREVVACDTDLFAAVAIGMNARINSVELTVSAKPMMGESLSGFDVLLAGDMFYERALGEAGLRWMREAARQGLTVLAGDPGRIYSPREGVRPVVSYAVPTSLELEERAERVTQVLSVLP